MTQIETEGGQAGKEAFPFRIPRIEVRAESCRSRPGCLALGVRAIARPLCSG